MIASELLSLISAGELSEDGHISKSGKKYVSLLTHKLAGKAEGLQASCQFYPAEMMLETSS